MTGPGLTGWGGGFSNVPFTEGDDILKVGPAPPTNRCFLRAYCVPGVVLGTWGDEKK